MKTSTANLGALRECRTRRASCDVTWGQAASSLGNARATLSSVSRKVFLSLMDAAVRPYQFEPPAHIELVLTGQIPAKTKATTTNKFNNNSPTWSVHGQCVCLQCHGARALPYIQERSVLCTIRVARDFLYL